jgi:DNA-directed RNA polymerase II subunit RPB2
MFEGKPTMLVKHQLDSYNAFVGGGLQRVFREKNPIRLLKEQDVDTGIFANQCNIYLGGEDGSKVYFGRPVVSDGDTSRIMYPNIARMRDMSYSTTIHVEVVAVFSIEGQEEVKVVLPKVFIGKFPIMLMSDLCVLNGLASSIRQEYGECADEKGGYFIVDGSEKVIISQEKFADNMLYVRKMAGDKYEYAADVRSVSENASKPTRVVSVRIVTPTTTSENKQIVVVIANVRKPIPLFIVMRALGVLSDKEIIEICLLDLEEYKSYIDLFRPSIHDAGPIFSQINALKYIASFTKYKTVPHAMELLSDYFLPHVGEVDFKSKALYLGHMVRELLRVRTGDTKPTDRDSFLYKRVELPGELLTHLFKEYLTIQYKAIYQRMDKEYTYKTQLYKDNFVSLLEKNASMIFSDRIVEDGFRKAFKGNWGATAGTKRMGIVQTLNRLSFNSALSHLRKLNLTFDSGAKITGPRLLHGSQWGLIDPIDTPDGGNVGLHKHLAIATEVSVFRNADGIIAWSFLHGMSSPADHNPSFLAKVTKVFINGRWIGILTDPVLYLRLLRVARRCGFIPILTSISWYISTNTINIYTDGGRLCRPLYWLSPDTEGSIMENKVVDKIRNYTITWQELTIGKGKEGTFDSLLEKYNVADVAELERQAGVIDMLDTNEEENALIAFSEDGIGSRTTHLEIDPSYMLGVMGNQVVFPENNPLPRDLFACGQMRQAVSVYHSNYQTRIDKMGVVLNDGQTPLAKSRYLKHISNNKHPYGVNVICAIMCYGGYNVEDSILFNKGSLDRGLFRTTYYNSYSA